MKAVILLGLLLRLAAGPDPVEPVIGVATWYGPGFQGEVMRNGERFGMEDATIAAANRWPLGTRLVILNPQNRKAVVVTVKDTGAFGAPVILDLSRAAFQEIADPDQGVVQVAVWEVDP